MRLAIPKETRPGETRVAATPESVKKLKSLGLDIVVQAGAGAGAKIADADYLAAGATIAPDAASAVRDADIVLMVRGPQGPRSPISRRAPCVAALAVAPYRTGQYQRPGRGRRHRLRHGIAAAHFPRPVDGRAVVARPTWPATRR